ncbi:hypothetical protein [Haloferax sp. KTX1]|uniref:hypothetical protein n=1 Tax=Haloferax sp. KTX1 TaxID=2600597 RepID=UPI0011DD985F|nr:hypothetical protein [Haloferax sp. KTX1]
MTENEGGILAETKWSDNTFGSYSDCDSSVSHSFEMKAGVAGHSPKSYDQIESHESNPWEFFCHFSELPESPMFRFCDNGNTMEDSRPRPVNFQFDIQAKDYYNGDQNYDEISLDRPKPQNNETVTKSHDWFETVLDIAGTSSNVYVGVGAAIVKFLTGDGKETDVTPTENHTEFVFDIPLKKEYDNLPQKESDGAHSAQTHLTVFNDMPPGDSYSLIFNPEYTFEVVEQIDASPCSCDNFDWKTYTTVPGTPLYPEFESV